MNGANGTEIGFVPASPEATPRQVGFVLALFFHSPYLHYSS